MKSTFSGEDLIEKAKRLNERAEQEKNELIRRLKMRDEEKSETEENQTLVASKVDESQTLIAHEIPRSGKESAVLTGTDSLGGSDVGYHHESKKTVENSPEIASDYSLIEENLSHANRNHIAPSAETRNDIVDKVEANTHAAPEEIPVQKDNPASKVPEIIEEIKPVKEELHRLNSNGTSQDSNVRIPRVLPIRPSTDFAGHDVHRQEKNGHADNLVQAELEGHSNLRDHRANVEHCGVGVMLGLEKKTGKILVSNVEAGSSAAKCGIQVGSVVMTIDGARVQGMKVTEVNEMLLGAAHTAVVIGLQDKRYGPEVRDFAVIRQAPRPHVPTEKKVRSSTENIAYRSQSSSDLSTTSTEGRSSRQDLDGEPWPVQQQSDRSYKSDNQLKDRLFSDYENGGLQPQGVSRRGGSEIRVLSPDQISRVAIPSPTSMSDKKQNQDFDAWLHHLEQHMVRGKSRNLNQSFS
mmetsp:Transcript_44335/g.139884  ORF Transcript_44335/g.139884 Transcript_44335/m.139884 type:complete len:465 (+) Transcript_44335:237-1631(+)